jgi:hypothetical protein
MVAVKEYEIGYGKPPKHTQFKKGVCPNPKGRGKRHAADVDEIMAKFLDAPVKVPDRGRGRGLTRKELSIKRLVAGAVKGDVQSAALLLKVRGCAEATNDLGPMVIIIENDPDKICREK